MGNAWMSRPCRKALLGAFRTTCALRRLLDAATVFGQHSDNCGLLGRLLDTQQSKNVPKSPENEMHIQLSPESEDEYRLRPSTKRTSEYRPKQNAKVKLKRSPNHLFRTSSQV